MARNGGFAICDAIWDLQYIIVICIYGICVKAGIAIKRQFAVKAEI